MDHAKQYKIIDKKNGQLLSWTLRESTEESIWLLDCDISMIVCDIDRIVKVAEYVFSEINEKIEIILILARSNLEEVHLALEADRRYKDNLKEKIKEQLVSWVNTR